MDPLASSVAESPAVTVPGASRLALGGWFGGDTVMSVVAVSVAPVSSTTVTLGVTSPVSPYRVTVVGAVVLRSTVPSPSRSQRYSTMPPSSVEPEAFRVTDSLTSTRSGASRLASGGVCG